MTLVPVDTTSEVAITSYLQQARDWLTRAVDETGPEQIAAAKAEIATAAEATKQLGLSKEIREDAAEMVRRAEWALRKATKKAQDAGAVRSREANLIPGGPSAGTPASRTSSDLPSARDFFAGKQEYEDANAMGELDAAVTRRVILWQNGIRANSGGNYVPTKTEQNELWRTDPTLRSAVEATVQMGRRALLPPSIVGLTWWLFSNISVEDCTAFWYGVSTGANLEPGSPILLLRERVAKAIGEPGRIPESHLLAWTIKAWNLWRQGRTLSTNYRGFALKPLERFPEPR